MKRCTPRFILEVILGSIWLGANVWAARVSWQAWEPLYLAFAIFMLNPLAFAYAGWCLGWGQQRVWWVGWVTAMALCVTLASPLWAVKRYGWRVFFRFLIYKRDVLFFGVVALATVAFVVMLVLGRNKRNRENSRGLPVN